MDKLIGMFTWVALIGLSVLLKKKDKNKVKREVGNMLVKKSWREGKEDEYDQDTFYAYVFFLIWKRSKRNTMN